MINVRGGTFETNSSSTHSIVICSKKQFDDWKSGKVLFDPYKETFLTAISDEQEKKIRDEAELTYSALYNNSKFHKSWNELDSDAKEEFIKGQLNLVKPNKSTLMTYNSYRYYYQEGCDYSEKQFVTEHGDTVIAFGKGGYN
jgi:hypothetical protein